jgi:hypothetical protein
MGHMWQRVCCIRPIAFPRHAMLCVLWCVALLVSASAQANNSSSAAPTKAGPLVRRVATATELQQAFDDAVQHIVVTAHLDLRPLPGRFDINWKGYAFSSPVFINRGTVSVRVRQRELSKHCMHMHVLAWSCACVIRVLRR